MDKEAILIKKFERLKFFLNEKQVRLWAATEAIAIGYGGISIVFRSTGISRRAITIGCQELKAGSPEINKNRVRKTGGGRKKISSSNPEIKKYLEELIAPATRGDPESLLKWTSKSVRNLSNALKENGFSVSHQTVASLLFELGYSLQANKKSIEGSAHPDRNEQFEYINRKAKEFQDKGYPVISVDTKKKELVGKYSSKGREYQPKKTPELVNTYDFPDKLLGKVSPYGVYDIKNNLGWVNVGVDHDTAQFAVQSIRSWWCTMGKKYYKTPSKILITADGGGSNGSRVKLWKIELQKLANEISMEISVCHFPPGTSKWNKIEHRLFSFISQNWRGKPLVSHQVIVNLIASTKTKTGLKVECQLDKNPYQKGIKVSDEELGKINLIRDNFHGEWNYTVCPQEKL